MCVRRNAGICALIYGVTVLAAPATGSAQILTSGSTVNRSDPASSTGAPLAPQPATSSSTAPSATGNGGGPVSTPPAAPAQTTAPAGTSSFPWSRGATAPTSATPSTASSSASPSTESISGWRPLIDTKGVNAARYETDLRDCQTFASQNREAERANVKKGALRGGLITGGIVVAATVLTGGVALLPMMAGTAAAATGVGALNGAAEGAAVADAAWRGTVSSCLRGRGYTVLN